MNGEITGHARLGRRTKDLVKRLGPEDVAIVDHADIDRVSAQELVESGVRAVVNVSRSTTGRFPNPGPLELVRAGVRLVDAPGAPLFDLLSDGELVRVEGGSVWRNGTLVAEGTLLDAATLAESLTAQQGRVTHALEAFAENTLRHLQEEAGTLAAGIDLPPLRTRFRDHHVLVVARGPGYKSDLRMVRPYIRDFRPVLVAVDGGADALREVGLAADLIVGDFDSVTDGALQSGAELVVHGYPGGGAPGAERLRRLGLEFHTVFAPGISEDLALQLAYEKGATLIVAVGTHFNLVEFLERDRAGMASTFVTRLKVGESLVDAKGVSRLVSRRVGIWPLAVFAATGVAAIVGAVLASPALRNVLESMGRAIGNGLGL
ncbi:MAG TPA: putative cytokinetic ring protein SteA [Gaiella sp.]|uniref:putative cytokinetic ring protein SteA n=1 Tax=Gaiella sp. TaxID=2663207 RepID=UPI002D800CB3|nr:putative cytokinetic ring protein SteA [Gaiella sp.]HET9288044.1 putative cytokinetic ring protein SteA [Gaiella sp.]